MFWGTNPMRSNVKHDKSMRKIKNKSDERSRKTNNEEERRRQTEKEEQRRRMEQTEG